ncbi:hypothetical protein Aduo_004642 [Ancylostoma duodenale]
MFRFATFLLTLMMIAQLASALSLMERHIAKQNTKQRLPEQRAQMMHDFVVDHEDSIGRKSIFSVGSFRGRPIMSRQKNVYVDDNGEALSILPYNDDSRRIHSRPNRYGG